MARVGQIRRILTILGLLLVVGVIGSIVYFSRTQWVPAGHVGVIYSAQGGLQRKVILPRRVFIPWMAQLYVYPTFVQAAIYTNDSEEGEVKAADAVQVTTNDNANTPFDIVVWYHVKPEDVFTVFDSFRAVPIREIQSQHIRGAVRQAASVVGTQYDAFQLMGPKRKEASQKLTVELQGVLARKGISIDRAEFADAYPSDEILARITRRLNSLTDLRIAQIRQDIAQVERDTAVITARAQAQANALTSSQTKDRSLEMLRLEADEAAIARWNGRISPIQVRPGQPVVVTPDLLTRL
ncbi:MAG: hypothetical protein FJX77_16250, partial [Armatimonadetes bacterium]|nr:hypothetical protein [Armatimonadota bacterium]